MHPNNRDGLGMYNVEKRMTVPSESLRQTLVDNGAGEDGEKVDRRRHGGHGA